MRRQLHATPFLSLAVFLLLLMHGAGGCLAAAHRRALDEGMWGGVRPSATAVLRELPRKGQGATQAYTVAEAEEGKRDWVPIRIAVSTEDLTDPSKHCTKEKEKKPDFKGQESECTKTDILTPEMTKTLVGEILPVAVKLHAERLLVQRAKSPLVVPSFEAGHEVCQYFTVPEAHHKAGVKDADMVLYVASR
ncbi:surface protease GP63 [Trypanosoma rangeli SC58]|uniref:Leishmanolysin-like peptidase n=1 Tax=Trypanosoma rangeli SC58 TaxID=429131 RepID=A0A061J1F2_TRYRA|nr:surface protease GP63 [Trypanosoma rangeli SC58]